MKIQNLTDIACIAQDGKTRVRIDPNGEAEMSDEAAKRLLDLWPTRFKAIDKPKKTKAES